MFHRVSVGPETPWSMIAAAARGDDAAQHRFHRLYASTARAFLTRRWRRRVLANDIDDALQDVFLECFRQQGALSRAESGRGEFRGFFLGIVANIAARFERRLSRSRLRAQTDVATSIDVATDATRVSIAFDRAWARSLMQEAGRLHRTRAGDDADARQRIDLLRARIVDGRAIRHIAAEWEVDPDLLHRAYARARREYYACLREVVARHCGPKSIESECQWLLEILGRN